MNDLVIRLGSLLTSKSHTLSVAESLTGGLVSTSVVSVPGVSSFFRGGVVAYGNDSKESILGVRHQTLAGHGAVSRETALEMAHGVSRIFNSTMAVSTTGIAGPTGSTKDKPVGLAYIAVIYAGAESVSEQQYAGIREQVRNACSADALRMCIEAAEKNS
jgi:PncC family amidohydrolase